MSGYGAVEELFGFGLRHRGAAEAGADGIDEDEVSEVEPCAGIVHEIGGIGGAVAFVAGVQMLGADGAEVQIDGGCAGTAIEGEGDRPVVAFHGVGGDHHFAGDFAVVVAHGKRANGDGVVQGLAVELDGLLDVRLGGQRGQAVLSSAGFGGGLVFIGRWGWRLVGLRQSMHRGDRKAQKSDTREERGARRSSSRCAEAHCINIHGRSRALATIRVR